MEQPRALRFAQLAALAGMIVVCGLLLAQLARPDVLRSVWLDATLFSLQAGFIAVQIYVVRWNRNSR